MPYRLSERHWHSGPPRLRRGADPANALDSKLHRASSREVAVAERLVPPGQTAHAGDKYREADALQA
jgi:hypothetical protein